MPGMVRGVDAELRWAYYVAARVKSYTVVRETDAPVSNWALTATVVECDAFKLAQRPLIFYAPTPKGAGFRWPVVHLSTPLHVGGVCTAVLGVPLP